MGYVCHVSSVALADKVAQTQQQANTKDNVQKKRQAPKTPVSCINANSRAEFS